MELNTFILGLQNLEQISAASNNHSRPLFAKWLENTRVEGRLLQPRVPIVLSSDIVRKVIAEDHREITDLFQHIATFRQSRTAPILEVS